jgi:hypothetical protein
MDGFSIFNACFTSLLIIYVLQHCNVFYILSPWFCSICFFSNLKSNLETKLKLYAQGHYLTISDIFITPSIFTGNSSVWSPEERLYAASDPSGATDYNVLTRCLKGDHQYVALRRQEVVRWANSSSTEKTQKKKKKWYRSTRWRPTANGERSYDWPLGM